MCYKMRLAEASMSSEIAIHQAPNGLGNLRETKGFAIGNRTGNRLITTAQIGNNFAHTVRDGSQENWIVTRGNIEVYAENPEMAASPSKMTWARGATWI